LAHAHQELKHYLLSAGTEAFYSGVSVMKPMLLTWNYKLWHDIFVAPVIVNETKRMIIFPFGDDWVDYWDSNSTKVYIGGSIVDYPAPITRIPVFLRKGSIIPLHVTTSYLGHGDESSAGALTLLLSHPKPNHHELKRIYEENGGGLEVTYTRQGSDISLQVSSHPLPLIFLIRGLQLSESSRLIDQTRCGKPLSRLTERSKQTGFFYDAARNELWIRPEDGSERGVALLLTNISDVKHKIEPDVQDPLLRSRAFRTYTSKP
jgi:hypothetical protein